MSRRLFVGGSAHGQTMDVRDDVHQLFLPSPRSHWSAPVEPELYLLEQATFGIPDQMVVIPVMMSTSVSRSDAYGMLLEMLAPVLGGTFHDLRTSKEGNARAPRSTLALGQ